MQGSSKGNSSLINLNHEGSSKELWEQLHLFFYFSNHFIALFTKILPNFDFFFLSKIPLLDNIDFYIFLAKKAKCKQTYVTWFQRTFEFSPTLLSSHHFQLFLRSVVILQLCSLHGGNLNKIKVFWNCQFELLQFLFFFYSMNCWNASIKKGCRFFFQQYSFSKYLMFLFSFPGKTNWF